MMTAPPMGLAGVTAAGACRRFNSMTFPRWSTPSSCIATAPRAKFTGSKSLDADIVAGALNGPFDVKGTLAYNAQPLTLAASIGEIDAGQAAAVSVSVGLDGAGTSVKYDGTMDLDAGPTFDGLVSGSAENLVSAGKALGALAGQATELPDMLAKASALSVKVTASPETVSAKNLSLTLGDVEITGAATATLSPAISFDVQLAVPRTVDLAAFGLEDLGAPEDADTSLHRLPHPLRVQHQLRCRSCPISRSRRTSPASFV